MRAIIENLCHLQELEISFNPSAPEVSEKTGGLRLVIPESILAHYDRLRARGKKGVALVRDQVCTECHMRVATGILGRLRNGTDIQICGSCGRYLQLAPETEASPAALESAAKMAKKKRRPRTPIHVH